jgi:hypothetical protein
MATPRPEPVLDEAKIASTITGWLTLALGVATVTGFATTTQVSALGAAGIGIVTGAVTLINYFVPIWRARKAREKVTPLADPHNAKGETLVPGVLVPPPGPL